jgi:hypothetical protein
MATLKDAILAQQRTSRRKHWHEKLPPKVRRELIEVADAVRSGEVVATIADIYSVLCNRHPGTMPSECMVRRFFRDYKGTEPQYAKAKVGSRGGKTASGRKQRGRSAS